MAQTQSEIKHTKYEKTRIIGARALQLSQGAPLNIKLSKKQLEELGYDVLKIAKLEYEQGKIPIVVERPLPEAQVEEEKEK